MRHKVCFVLCGLLLSAFAFSGCEKGHFVNPFGPPGQTPLDSVPPNRPPIARAGVDQTILLPVDSVNLDGSGSTDPDNNISYYQWTKISGPAGGIIINSNVARVEAYQLTAGVYQFELKVTDAGGLFSRDTVSVTVTSPLKHWLQLAYLDAGDFFFNREWFGGDNFLMGIDSQVFAISHHGVLWTFTRQSNNWSRIGNFPETMANAPIVFSVNHKGYCIGNGHNWEYDPVSNQWTKKKDPAYSVSVPLVLGNLAYFQGANRQMVSYDALTDSFTVLKSGLPDLGTPDPNWFGGAFTIRGLGYYVGGGGQTWQYDPSADSWRQKATFPQATSVFNTSSFSSAAYGYLIGDLNEAAYNNNQTMKVWRYDPAADQWATFEEDYPGYGVYKISTLSLGGTVYVGLGYNNGDFNAIDFWLFRE